MWTFACESRDVLIRHGGREYFGRRFVATKIESSVGAPDEPLEKTPTPVEMLLLPALRSSNWQMAFGERAALEGLLAQLRPKLAVELGTAHGGSLQRIAAYSEEVHTFDLVDPPIDRTDFPNVYFHVGDSHQLLPATLEALGADGRMIDFVLVDGDHSAEGVKQDVEDLLRSESIGRTLILAHDTMNETVREGLERVPFEAYPKVAYVDLDFVAGYMFREVGLAHELWGGLGLVVVDARRKAYFSEPIRQSRYYEMFPLMSAIRDLVLEQEGPPEEIEGG
jgi:Methyltransferase domain